MPSWFAKGDELVKVHGEFKKVEITLSNGEIVRATERVGTRLIFEDALLVDQISTPDAIRYCEAKGLKLPTGIQTIIMVSTAFQTKIRIFK